MIPTKQSACQARCRPSCHHCPHHRPERRRQRPAPVCSVRNESQSGDRTVGRIRSRPEPVFPSLFSTLVSVSTRRRHHRRQQQQHRTLGQSGDYAVFPGVLIHNLLTSQAPRRPPEPLTLKSLHQSTSSSTTDDLRQL